MGVHMHVCVCSEAHVSLCACLCLHMDAWVYVHAGVCVCVCVLGGGGWLMVTLSVGGVSPEDLSMHPGSTTRVLGLYQFPSPLPSLS